AEAGREVGHRGAREEQEEDQPDRAKGADTAVAHDAEPVLGVSAHEPIEAVREAVEVEAAGEDLPRGHRQERGEERREQDARHALDADQDEPEAEPDDRKPARRAPERVHAVRRAPRQRHDRQVAHGAVDLSDTAAALAIYTPGPMGDGNWTIGAYVDERARDDQRRALEQIFTGRAGGIPGVIWTLAGKRLPTRAAPIEFGKEGRRRWARIGDV